MNTYERTELTREDRQLVDLVTTALVDPSLHTDTRMRLQDEITGLLRATDERAHGSAGREAPAESLTAHDRDVAQVLESVLIDPNLHTDARMRLHSEIAELLSSAR